MKDSNKLEILWDMYEQWWQSTVIWWVAKVYKIYHTDRFWTLVSLKEYRKWQNKLANKNPYQVYLDQAIDYDNKKINQISIEVLELPDAYYKWTNIQWRNEVLIHEIDRIEWPTLFGSFKREIVKKILYQISYSIYGQAGFFYEQLSGFNIKIVWVEDWILKLIITDISKNIYTYPNMMERVEQQTQESLSNVFTIKSRNDLVN